MLEKRKIHAFQLLEAWNNWKQAFDNPTLPEFEDFLDPIRQTDIQHMLVDFNNGTDVWLMEIQVPEQIARRIDALAGPHFYAYLKANKSRVARCKTAWGRRGSKLTWK